LILDLLTNEIHRLKGAVGRGMYEVGLRLARIADEQLWQGRGYQSFEHYLEAGVAFSRATGYKLIRIARQFNAEIAERYADVSQSRLSEIKKQVRALTGKRMFRPQAG
jgi:hypothetical protein